MEIYFYIVLFAHIVDIVKTLVRYMFEFQQTLHHMSFLYLLQQLHMCYFRFIVTQHPCSKLIPPILVSFSYFSSSYVRFLW